MIATKEWVKSLLSKLNIGKYSTDEIRIGTWIDGKPLYRKVVNFTTDAYDFNLAHNIDIDEPIKFSGIYTVTVKSSGASLRVTDMDYVGRTSYSISGWLTKTDIRIAIGDAWRNDVNTIAILEYTKTTD